MDKIISIIGDYGWLFLKFSKMFLRLIENLIFTLNFENIIFTIFLLLNFYFYIHLLKKFKLMIYFYFLSLDYWDFYNLL